MKEQGMIQAYAWRIQWPYQEKEREGKFVNFLQHGGQEGHCSSTG